MNTSFASRIRDLECRLANIVRVGVIASLDEGGARATVKIGRNTTAPLPWIAQRAGPDAEWWAPEPGEQVVVLSPGGRFNLGVILPAIFQTAYPAPANTKTKRVTMWADGASLTYDRAAHFWHLDVPDGSAEVKVTTNGKITLTAAGKVTITGSEIDLVGPVKANSTIDALGDVTAGGKSLEHHQHSGVTAGGSVTGPPL